MDKYLSKKIKVLSFLAMIMVVFLHAYISDIKSLSGTINFSKGYALCFQYFFSQGITRVAVPFFYLFSGYLFFLNMEGTIKEFVTKFKTRLTTLALPYLLWSLWALVIYYVLQTIPQSKDFFTNKLIKNYTFSELSYTIFIDPIAYQLWFIRDLVVLVLLSPIVWLLVKYLKYAIVPVLVFTWCIDFNFILFSNEALLFFVVGALFSLDEKKILQINLASNHKNYLFLWLSIVFCKTLLFYFDYDENAVVMTVFLKTSIVVGILAIWSSYDFLFENKKDEIGHKFNMLVSFSFFIYVFHEPVLTIIKKACFYVMGKDEFASFSIYLVAPILTICASLFVGYFLKQITPKFYNLITGGR
jgi:surface polysaccharide O-acyltransferase-like enzyme